MNAIYPTKYQDHNGAENTVIENNGYILRMIVRGVEFSGPDFDSLSAIEPGIIPTSSSLSSFLFQHSNLCDCSLEVEMPVPVVVQGGTLLATLLVYLDLGKPEPESGGISHERLKLTLVLADNVFESHPNQSLFEDALTQIQAQLPQDTYIKCCFNCALSDYSPYGVGMFGCLACFRDNKPGYRAVNSKAALFQIWDTMTEFVQETYLCPEFEKRVAGTGYRG